MRSILPYRYSVRTVLGPFDKQFNAITGLNGSGKSNVLDGICFVLGITNLSKVRAGNLSELVYKQGQAGITKASVTVVLNNSDRARSPVKYESCDQITVCRQVVIGGRNRFFINGKVSQHKDVTELFQSVQLNINNPHFLIMQGSITKVINMKPAEILKMIEEAAGTSLYEAKKTEALRFIERKQLKVDEIDRIFKDEIHPQLTKLKEEKKAFLEWSSLVKQVEDIEKLVVSWDYRNVAGKLAGGGGQYDETAKELKRWSDSFKQLQVSVTKGEEKGKSDIKSLEKQKSSQEDTQGKLDDDAQACQRELARLKTILKDKSATLKSNTGKQAKSKSVGEKLEKEIFQSHQHLVSAEEALVAAKQALVDCEAQIEAQQKLAADLTAGGSGAGSSGQSLEQELIEKKSKVDEISVEIKSVSIKLKGLETQLKQLQVKGKQSASSEFEKLTTERNIWLEKKEEAEKKISSIQFNPGRFQEVGETVRTNERKIEAVTEQLNSITATLNQRLQVDLGGAVDGSKIKGMVAKLIHIKPEFGDKYARALEILAGGKLFNVVVDSAKTATEIFESNRMRKRVTLLPLDQLKTRQVTKVQIAEAQRVALRVGGEALPAIETIAFTDEVTKAMELVFADAFVCDKSDIGKQVTFSKDLPDRERPRTVTVDGDVYDPRGSLTGGDDNGRGIRIMGQIFEVQKLSYELQDLQQRTAVLQGEKQRMQTFKDAWEKTHKDLVSLNHSLNLLDSRLKGTSQSQHAEEVAAVEDLIRSNVQRMRELEEARNGLRVEVERIEKNVADITKNKAEKIKSATAQVAALKKDKKAKSDDVKTAEATVAKLVLASKTAEEELVSFKEDLTNQSAISSALETEISELETKIETAKDKHEALQAKLKELKIFTASFDKAIADIIAALEAERQKMDEAEINSKKFESLMQQLDKDRKEAKTEVERLEKEFAWLRQQRDAILADESIGSKSKAEMDKLRNKLVDIRDDVTIKGKTINRRIIPLIERSEREAEDLLAKRDALEKEKKAIHEFISELDDKKGRALSKTWQIVNANFGAIFRSLLPNVDAKLAPPEGMSALEGLELRVQLGSVWKDSLTELSGGQKSLLALSLVLALLLFKPAPFYILDEVDAALDVSHTRNIGRMIKQHFPHSQFIIVSLKDGMFNNANVLFRVRFENGTSVVSRNQQSVALADEHDVPAAPAPRAVAASKQKSKPRKAKAVDSEDEDSEGPEQDGAEQENPAPVESTRRRARN